MNRIGLCLEPLDVLFFRDGRAFDATSKVTSGLPNPQVLAGSIRTALLEKHKCSFELLKKPMQQLGDFKAAVAEAFPNEAWIGEVKFRGPWLCRLPEGETGTAADVFLPVPATVHLGKKGAGGVQTLKPLKKGCTLPGWVDKGNLRPLWLTGTAPTEAASNRFISSAGLNRFLSEQSFASDTLHIGEGDPNKPGPPFLYSFDTRVGIGVDGSTLTAGDGEIYGIRFLSLKPGIGFYAEVLLPPTAPPDAFTGVRFLAFGGEGKRVVVHQGKPFPFPEPPLCDPTKHQKRFLLLTTPRRANDDGTPYLPADCVAAAVNAPIAISGWDMAKNGPKPTRFASPAGSVYFLNSDGDVPETTDEFGYGCHLQGVWTDE